jgi:uncharacterized protein YggU (UPF0235/DUF167 family)
VADEPWLEHEAWHPRPDGLDVRLKVKPRGGRDAIDGVEALSDGRRVLKVRVRAVPEDGAANDAVRRLLAKAMGCPASTVALETGATARLKIFRVAGDPTRLAAALGSALAAAAGEST